MQKTLKIVALICMLGSLSLAAWPVRAEEGAAPAAKPDAPKKVTGGEEAEGGASKSKAPSDTSGGRFAGDPVYVHLAPLVLPAITENGVEQLITIQLDVEVKDFDVADKMHANMPRVMDALMTALYGGLGQGSLRNGKLVDVAKVKMKAAAAVDRVLGGNVQDVLVQGVSQRML